MFGLKTIPIEQLAALRFADEQTFREAARLAAEHKIPVEAPGEDTLIVRKTDAALFRDARLMYREERVVDAEKAKVSSRELGGLRNFYRTG
jgi:hypothetical protein